jgi:hypothetical protein
MTAYERAFEFLRERGADAIAHPGGTLLAHLERTRALLASWSAEDALVLAGLCHAAYGTDGFPQPLQALDRRAELAERIGEQAEGIVYAYCSCDRRYGLPGLLGHDDMRDRFTERSWTPSRELARQLAELTAANELDLCLHGALVLETKSKLVIYLRSLRSLLRPAAADALDALTQDGART